MSRFTTIAITRKARKAHRCIWCWEWIEAGEHHQTYVAFDDGSAATVRFHPECYESMHAASIEEGGRFEWTPGMERPLRTQEVLEP